MRTIRVTGKGTIKVKPDVTRITLELEGLCHEYRRALRESADNTEKLKDLMATLGFDRSDLKTLNFSVNTEYDHYKEGEQYRSRFAGYRYRHQMKVEFDSDNERLGKILYALARCRLRPEFRLSYTVKDPERAKNELLGRAVTDAKDKAAVLARAADVTLKQIENIDYSWEKVNFEVYPVRSRISADVCCDEITEDDSYDINVEPEDIEVSDTVTIIWEIG